MKLILTIEQMKMLLDKIGPPNGKILTTTSGELDKILSGK